MTTDVPYSGPNLHVPIPEPTYFIFGDWITVLWGDYDCGEKLDGRDPEVQALEIACAMAKDVFGESDGIVGAFERFKQHRVQGQDGQL